MAGSDWRECHCPSCSAGRPGGAAIVSRATWHRHRARRREVSAAGDTTGAAAADADDGGADAEPGREDGGSECVPRSNGVCVPVDVFRAGIDNYVAYTFSVQHGLTRSATENYLRQRSRLTTFFTPQSLDAFAEASVDLHTLEVDSCRKGCLAFTGDKEDLDKCCFCAFPRFRGNGTAVKTTTYWLLASWLQNMLANPVIGPGMVRSMSRARSAATEPVAGVRDWYDGAIFRSAVSAGYFASITSVALSISTDGFEAWRQRGYQGWPVIATVLNVEPHETVRLSSQLMLCVTPGPRQPADLESFLHPIAKQLDILARGISGVKVAECPTSQVVHAYAL